MTPARPAETAKVYCPMCTHTVDADIQHPVKTAGRFSTTGGRDKVRAGQKCPNCSASLDAGDILPKVRAA